MVSYAASLRVRTGTEVLKHVHESVSSSNGVCDLGTLRTVDCVSSVLRVLAKNA